jgi:hypothetical protein
VFCFEAQDTIVEVLRATKMISETTIPHFLLHILVNNYINCTYKRYIVLIGIEANTCTIALFDSIGFIAAKSSTKSQPIDTVSFGSCDG